MRLRSEIGRLDQHKTKKDQDTARATASCADGMPLPVFILSFCEAESMRQQCIKNYMK
jgi:hypothetical protein